MYQFCCHFKRFALKIVVEDTRETIHRSEQFYISATLFYQSVKVKIWFHLAH